MAKTGPSRLRPLTLRLLTAPARAYKKDSTTSLEAVVESFFLTEHPDHFHEAEQ